MKWERRRKTELYGQSEFSYGQFGLGEIIEKSAVHICEKINFFLTARAMACYLLLLKAKSHRSRGARTGFFVGRPGPTMNGRQKKVEDCDGKSVLIWSLVPD